MKIIAYKMKLNKGMEAEYKKRHDEIWPQILQVLKDAGVSDYSIFLDKETNILFVSLKLADNREMNSLSKEPIMQKWCDYMADIMETRPDNFPKIKNLVEVFHMD